MFLVGFSVALRSKLVSITVFGNYMYVDNESMQAIKIKAYKNVNQICVLMYYMHYSNLIYIFIRNLKNRMKMNYLFLISVSSFLFVF